MKNEKDNHAKNHHHEVLTKEAEVGQMGLGATEQDEHSAHSAHHDHHDHSAHDPNIFRKRFWISLILTIPVLLYSAHLQQWFNFKPPDFDGSAYIPLFFSTIIFFYGGLVFIKSAGRELKARRPGMMSLISLAILVAYIYSVLVAFGLSGEEIFWELATLIVIMLLGHWIEMSAVMGAQNALSELAQLMPDQATLITPDGEKMVAVSALKPGDLVLVRPGERLPADGHIRQGQSYVNEAIITGEAEPVPKKTGDRVLAGSINEDGALRIEVAKTSDDTVLAGIMRLVEEAQKSRSRSQVLADQAAFYLTIVAVSAALLTALLWGFKGAGSSFIMERVVTVLVIACPHALGLAIPLVVAISTTLAAKRGLLIKDRLALEKARLTDLVVFDKTGTLTSGALKVAGVKSLSSLYSEKQILSLAARAEKNSEHSIARAVLNKAETEGLLINAPVEFEALAGRGVKAALDGKTVYVGGPNLLEVFKLKTGHRVYEEASGEAAESGHGFVYVVIDDEVAGLIAFSDTVREESKEAVQSLQKAGVKVAILTGDNLAAAQSVAAELGIEQVFAQVLPENKAEIIKNLKQQGFKVAMVGDGINDAPALISADVGIAIGAGTDVAVESAGIILVKNDPRDVVRLIDLSRLVYRKMLQNLAWAAGYNILAIPLAAGALSFTGFVMPMAAGAVVMSASTIIVAINAQLLRLSAN